MMQEEREIDDVCYSPNVRHWYAVTHRIDGTDPKWYWLKDNSNKPRPYLEKYIHEYAAANPEYDAGCLRKLGPWDLQRDKILTKLATRQGVLRRGGCNPHGLEPPMARLLARTMCDSISTLGSEVWQTKEEKKIETRLNEIHRRILGIEMTTCTAAFRHELGIISQHARMDESALKFRNNILSLNDTHLIKPVYLSLAEENVEASHPTHLANGARDFLEPLAEEIGWTDALSVPDAKRTAKRHVEQRYFDDMITDIQTRTGPRQTLLI